MIAKISQVIAAAVQPVRQPTSPPATSVETQAMAENAVQTEAGSSKASTKALAAAVDQLNASIQTLNRNLEFSIDKNSGNVLVKVVDSQTHEVIRQIPSEQALELAQSLKNYEHEHERHIGLLQTEA